MKAQKLKVEVTAGDIARARRNVSRCPIECALERTLGVKRVVVSCECATVIGKGTGIDHFPLKAKRFMERYDGNKTVKPFSFVARLEEGA